MTDDEIRYPIGRVTYSGTPGPAERAAHIRAIAEAPQKLREAVAGLTPEQLATPYRDGGWTVRQVVHHLPDSHLNAYVRFKLALTEDVPKVKPYDQQRWAELEDARTAPVETSLTLLEALHERWVGLMRSLPESSFSRTLLHPDTGIMPIDKLLALYAWHGAHHTAQIVSLRKRRGW
jgi:uncharacterized damage-inducible protein DinB